MSNYRKKNTLNGQSYINDSLARKNYSYSGDTSPKRIELPQEQKNDRETVKKEEAVRKGGIVGSVGFAYSLLLIISAVFVTFNVVDYIGLNIDSSKKAKEIVNLREQVQTARMENDNYEMAINASIDYDYIYRVATEELGMVYASKSQIITYETSDSDYVVQYKNVD